jgi:putative intracellular protease/amidase
VTATENYELAYLNWGSKTAHDNALKTAVGTAVFRDAGEFMDTLMYEPSYDLVAGETIDHGHFYRTHQAAKKALIVVTSHDQLGATGKKTGYYFPEVAHPYYELSKKGIQVDIASPRGGLAPMDPKSLNLNDSVNKTLNSDKNFMKKLAATKRVGDIDPTQYSAIIFAGGHGTMWDFRDSKAIQSLTAQVYEQGGVVAAVCHGPAALGPTPEAHELSELVAINPNLGFIATHMHGTPEDMQLSPLGPKSAQKRVKSFFENCHQELTAAGFSSNKIFLDPGIGFGKTDSANLSLLAETSSFAKEFNVAIGVSRKGFIGRLFGGNSPQERDPLSKSVELSAILSGAKLIRTHDVRGLKRISSVIEEALS